MEDYITGHQGSEHQLREVMRQELRTEKANFFFDRLLDYFFTEEDIAFIKSVGANVVRLALNYRHFESDSEPFHYLEKGFNRLNRVIQWCASYGLYIILDMHSVQGWQNSFLASDSANRLSLFWSNPHYQERFYALWKEIAHRYQGNPTIAGYDIINEPITNAKYGLFRAEYHPNWSILNHVYRQAVAAIREVDLEHIIFLEGDMAAFRHEGLEPPFADNLVYVSHSYNAANFGPGPYPGVINPQQGFSPPESQQNIKPVTQTRWDLQMQREVFEKDSGRRFTNAHHTPLWMGEFGSCYNGLPEEIPDRLHALDDQLTVYNEAKVHWTSWTYKDINSHGWMQLDPESPYMQVVRHLLKVQRELGAEWWMPWLPVTPSRKIVIDFARLVENSLKDPTLDPISNQTNIGQHLLQNYVSTLMQPLYARCFAGMSENNIDEVLSSFAFKNCIPHKGLIDVMKKNLSF
jgi:aryl-phospho-beta-D-glucosidase BglC (GH1 family)